jgi:hypothetical protein
VFCLLVGTIYKRRGSTNGGVMGAMTTHVGTMMSDIFLHGISSNREVGQSQVSSRSIYIQLLPSRGVWPELPQGGPAFSGFFS